MNSKVMGHSTKCSRIERMKDRVATQYSIEPNEAAEPFASVIFDTTSYYCFPSNLKKSRYALGVFISYSKKKYSNKNRIKSLSHPHFGKIRS